MTHSSLMKLATGSEWNKTRMAKGAMVVCDGKFYEVQNHTKYSILAKDTEGNQVILDLGKCYT